MTASHRTICTEVQLCMKYRSCIDWMSMVVVVATLSFHFVIIFILEGSFDWLCMWPLCVGLTHTQHICLYVELCHPVPLTSCGKSWFWISDRELGLLWRFSADLFFFWWKSYWSSWNGFWIRSNKMILRILSGFQFQWTAQEVWMRMRRKLSWGFIYIIYMIYNICVF